MSFLFSVRLSCCWEVEEMEVEIYAGQAIFAEKRQPLA